MLTARSGVRYSASFTSESSSDSSFDSSAPASVHGRADAASEGAGDDDTAHSGLRVETAFASASASTLAACPSPAALIARARALLGCDHEGRLPAAARWSWAGRGATLAARQRSKHVARRSCAAVTAAAATLAASIA
eukprot:CAMPEP_0180075248 /NCGR_PEP_ID=MMETSP0985-20121206/14397_1 /TAXON_ID=483367 /ORGANISM="non described non described, Strain CCMP 2436" /LENGTH=136 /DNA_ID=CAMNT_0022007171 /DNA_START=302 /DNA_END=712 /DNA_ORIENTATION=-